MGLSAELSDHLGSEEEASAGNRRNCSSKKTMLTASSKLTLDIPRDRTGTFDPKLIAKYQRAFYAVKFLQVEVSPDLISTITDAVLETVSDGSAAR